MQSRHLQRSPPVRVQDHRGLTLRETLWVYLWLDGLQFQALLLDCGEWTDLLDICNCFRRRQAGVFATLSKSSLALIEMAEVLCASRQGSVAIEYTGTGGIAP